MGSFGPPRPQTNFQYDDLSQRLARMLIEGAELKRREALQTAALERQARLDEQVVQDRAQANEDRARQREREGIQEQVSLGALERLGAARTPELAGGGEPMEGALPGPPTEAESQGAQGQFQTITLPDGRTIPLGPLQSKATIDEETQKAATLALLQKLGYKEAETAIEARYRTPPKPDKTLEEIEAESEARARGGRRGAPPVAPAPPPLDTEAVQADANAWYEGRAFPTTQKAQSQALK